MGIAPYKTFTFDGTSSSAYGVYLTGEGVFNAPVRAVEMIEIPGRNGTFALDQGRFENITVTYQAGMYDVNESNFADKMSALRNWLCSKVGYCRLEDEYNANEYRMAVYASGLEVTHDMLIAGEFEITFECKPQRWLTSGETAVSVTSGDTLTNPTLFEASPLLIAEGDGNITVNGKTIKLNDAPLGRITLSPPQSALASSLKVSWGNTSFYNGTDTIYMTLPSRFEQIMLVFNDSFSLSDVVEVSHSGFFSYGLEKAGDNGLLIYYRGSNIGVTAQNPYTDGSATRLRVTTNDSTIYDFDTFCSVIYDATEGSVELDTGVSNWNSQDRAISEGTSLAISEVYVISSKQMSSVPRNIDLDIGEAYIESGGGFVSANNLIEMPSDLPTLVAGANTITFDNTITDLKIVPRWWKV